MSEVGPADNSRVFRRLLWTVRPYWGAIALGAFLVVLAAPCELFPAVVWKFITDDIALNNPTSPWLRAWFGFRGLISGRFGLLISATAWMFVIYLLSETLETIEQWVMNRAAQRFILEFRNRVYHKLQSQSLSYLQRQRTGDLMSRAMGDVDELQSFMVNGIDQIFSEGLLWCATVAVVMYYDWRVASASLSPLIVVYVLLRVFNRKIKPIYTAAREKTGEVSARLQENLSGIVVIKIFNREKEEGARFRKSTEAYYDKQIDAINARSLFFPFARVVGFFSNVFMIGLGGYFLLTEQGKPGGFTVGTLLLFRAYWWRLFGPIQTLARVNDMIQRALAAGKRVFEVLDAPEELPDNADATAVEQVRGEMELRDVSFAYGGVEESVSTSHGLEARVTGEVSGDTGFQPVRTARSNQGRSNPYVLCDVSIKIEPGKTVALVGPSGSGKSTILNLLLRFYDPTRGQVTLDGRDLRAITRDSLRSRFALVQQETFLFNDSILDNIRYGHAEATMEQVIAAAKAANAHGFISKLPEGYETKVGERGIRLSGGQKQRISIARAFLANPAILLLDEPTSSVEPEAEAAIIAALDRLMKGRTTVLTSHRPSLINQADYVYVIEEGRVTEQGTPGELASGGGFFSRFMRSGEGVVSEPEVL
jgi:ATP-binding cassette subfamily B protein